MTSRQLCLRRLVKSSRQTREIHSVTNFLVQFTSSVHQTRQPVLSTLPYTQNVAANIADHFKYAWDAGKITFGAFMLRGDLRLGVTENVLHSAEQILFQERLLEHVWVQSRAQSWKSRCSDIKLFPLSRADIIKVWAEPQFRTGSQADFRKRFTTVYLKNCLLDVENEFNCDLSGRVGWFIDPSTNERMFFPITAFDPDIRFTARLQCALDEIYALRNSTLVPDIHRCAEVLESVKDMLFQEELYRVLWLSNGTGIGPQELKTNSRFSVTPIDLSSRFQRAKAGEFEHFRYDGATDRFHLARQRQSFLDQLHKDLERRRLELLRIENLKRYTSAPELNRQFARFFASNLPAAMPNPLLYDETLLTQIFKSWTTHGKPTVEGFQAMLNLRCEEADDSLSRNRFPRACKLWRDYIRAHPEDTTLDYQPLLRLTHSLREGGFAMNVLRNRLNLGPVEEGLSLLALRTIQSTPKHARTASWLSKMDVSATGRKILAQPYEYLSKELVQAVQTLLSKANHQEFRGLEFATPPQVGLALGQVWRSQHPQRALPILRAQDPAALSPEDCQYIFPPLFHPQNGAVEHPATVPVILEALHFLAKCTQIDRNTKLEFLQTFPKLCYEIAQTERSCRSLELFLKTMEELELPISRLLWDAALTNYLRFSSHMAPLSVEDIGFWLRECDPSVRLCNRLLELALLHVVSRGCEAKMIPQHAEPSDNERLVRAVWLSMERLGIEPNIGTFNLTADFYAKLGDKEGVFSTLDSMAGRVAPDEQTLRILTDLYLDPATIQEYVLSLKQEAVADFRGSVERIQGWLRSEPRGQALKLLLHAQREEWVCLPAEGQVLFFPRTSELMSRALTNLEREIVALEEEPRARIQQLCDHYIQAHLPHFRHAFQIKPHVFREHVMSIIHDAKAELEDKESSSIYVHIYERLREKISSKFPEVSLEEIKKLTQIPSYPFLPSLSRTSTRAPQLRLAFSTSIDYDAPLCAPTSTLKSMQQFEDKLPYQNPSSIKILEDVVVEESEYEEVEYTPPVPPQLKALPAMFGRSTLQSNLVVHSSATVGPSQDLSRAVLFALPETRADREQSIHNLIRQALNSFTILQLCQNFLGDITHSLALEALVKLKTFQDAELASPRARADQRALLQEHGAVVARLIAVSASLHYMDADPAFGANLASLHEVYHHLRLNHLPQWLEHERVVEESLAVLTTEEAGRMLSVRLSFGKENTDLSHALLKHLETHPEPAFPPALGETLLTLLPAHHPVLSLVQQHTYYNGHTPPREDLMQYAESHAHEFVSSGNLDLDVFTGPILRRLSSPGLGRLLVGLVTHDRHEPELVQSCQDILSRRLMEEPENLDGSEIDALISCLTHFQLDMQVLLDAQEHFMAKHG